MNRMAFTKKERSNNLCEAESIFAQEKIIYHVLIICRFRSVSFRYSGAFLNIYGVNVRSSLI